MLKAVFFDLDGVLVDACDWHYQALNKALQKVVGTDIPPNEHIEGYNGLPTRQKLQDLVNRKIIFQEQVETIWNLKQEYTKETIIANAKPDAEKCEMLQFLNENNIYVGCVTNSIYETARMMLELTGQLKHLDCLISNDMVRYPKPHGEGYIIAMVKFRSDPNQTLIVEDSPKGIQAAKSTGAHLWEVKDATEVNVSNLQLRMGW